jgi:hypothetical protein
LLGSKHRPAQFIYKPLTLCDDPLKPATYVRDPGHKFEGSAMSGGSCGLTSGQSGAWDRARRAFETTRDQVTRSQEQIRLSLELLSRSAAAGLREYRAYFLDANGRIQSRTDLFCPNDEIARQRTLDLLDGQAIELWRGSCRIEKFHPEPRR